MREAQANIEVDCRGLSCPLPVVKAQKAIAASPGKIIDVLVDSDAAKENVTRLAGSRGYSVRLEKNEGGYRLVLSPPG